MLYFHLQAIAKNKREKALDIEELAKKGGGESYIDTSRGIAVGMGQQIYISFKNIHGICYFYIYIYI